MKRFKRYVARHLVVSAVTALSILVVIAVICLTWRFGVTAARPWAPIGALTVAAISLVVAAASTASTWRRQQRESTIKAWTDWSLSSYEYRRLVTGCLGATVVTRSQAISLVDPRIALANSQGEEVDAAKKSEVGNAMVQMLNGLERIASGVSLGVYDWRCLKALGGTIIVRTYLRFEPYIKERRNSSISEEQQKRVYTELEELAAKIQRSNYLDLARGIDKERLERLQTD